MKIINKLIKIFTILNVFNIYVDNDNLGKNYDIDFVGENDDFVNISYSSNKKKNTTIKTLLSQNNNQIFNQDKQHLINDIRAELNYLSDNELIDILEQIKGKKRGVI